VGTTCTFTVNALAAGAEDVDFRDIAITGAAAPLTGTRFGDCKGNSGITFPAAKTVYYRQTGSSNWGTVGAGSWSATIGGAADSTQFPLAQDTAVFPANTYPASGSTVTLSPSANYSYSIGTIDMSARTTNTMTLSNGSSGATVYGNWINGTGVTLSGTQTLVFAGRGAQTITSAGRTFTQSFSITSPGGSVSLQDNFANNSVGFNLGQGTFDAAGYSVSIGSFTSTSSLTRTIAFGSGAWTILSSGVAFNTTRTELTVTGTATINMNAATAKTFNSGLALFEDITLNQSGAGALTILESSTFKDITSTYSATAANTISIGGTTQTLAQFTGTGFSGKNLSIIGTSGASPGILVLTSGDVQNSDFLTVNFVRAFSLANTWYAGANSTLSNFLGWIPTPYPVNYGRFFLMFG
jgi:hypothetical protein